MPLTQTAAHMPTPVLLLPSKPCQEPLIPRRATSRRPAASPLPNILRESRSDANSSRGELIRFSHCATICLHLAMAARRLKSCSRSRSTDRRLAPERSNEFIADRHSQGSRTRNMSPPSTCSIAASPAAQRRDPGRPSTWVGSSLAHCGASARRTIARSCYEAVPSESSRLHGSMESARCQAA